MGNIPISQRMFFKIKNGNYTDLFTTCRGAGDRPSAHTTGRSPHDKEGSPRLPSENVFRHDEGNLCHVENYVLQ